MVIRESEHEGFTVLFATKGAGLGEEGAEWHIDQYHGFYNACWKLGALGRVVLAAILTLRWADLLCLDVHHRSIVVDCKSGIDRAIKHSGITARSDAGKLRLAYRRRRTFLSAIRLMGHLRKRIEPTCAEDCQLLVLYCWYYSAVSSALEDYQFASLVVAKDISPLSGALISIARDRKLPIGVYSLPGMGYERGVGDNRDLFSAVFVASRAEGERYERLGKTVFYSALPVVPDKLQPLTKPNPVVGLLLGSHRQWDWATAKQRIDDTINNILRAYDPAEVRLRAHPDERHVIRDLFDHPPDRVTVDEGPLGDYCQRVDFVVGGGTSAAIQVLEAGKIALYDPSIDCDYPRGPVLFNDGVLLSVSPDYPDAAVINAYYESDQFRAKLAEVFVKPKVSESYQAGLSSLLFPPGNGR